MPLITVSYATDRPDGEVLKPAIARLVTRFAASCLHKRPDLTAVIVQRVPAESWTVGGRTVAGSGLATYALTITITDGTNTKREKAAFLAAVHAGMAEVLGPLFPESYVHVSDARAEAYGYGGLTQEFRHVAELLDAATRNAAAAAAIGDHGVR
ncbi:tautomerase family protein [Chthonobacter rhizosphaerae]|uniref:tautomerase family protein n=1 Tax=Chthonobacter rhizosphaerae TaxID=2735553 RepID=UPI0015EE3F05|nr:4-oxalocrotonate tautomerase [Chthonobacter rhizosphaerae]